MKKLSNFLEKFRNLKPPAGTIENEISKIVFDICSLDEKDIKIRYKDQTLTIETSSSVIKNEVFIKKEKILDALKKKLRKEISVKIWFK